MVDLFKEFSLGDLSPVLAIWALLMARVMPLIIFAPFIGGDAVPTEVKMGIGVVFTILLFPFVSKTAVPHGSLLFIVLMLKEIIIGVTIALISSMVFDAARAAGTFLDTVGGTNQVTIFVPQIQQQVSLFADLKFQLTVVTFLTLNGHHVIIEALFLSFKTIPLDSWPHFDQWPIFENIIRVGANLFVVAIALAAPAAIAAFITDVSLGLVNRVAPQVQVFFISMSIKPMVVTIITLCALVVFYEKLQHIFYIMISNVKQVILLLH